MPIDAPRGNRQEGEGRRGDIEPNASNKANVMELMTGCVSLMLVTRARDSFPAFQFLSLSLFLFSLYIYIYYSIVAKFLFFFSFSCYVVFLYILFFVYLY